MIKTLDPLNDGKSMIALIDSMGSDLSIVNDAKASFERVSEEMGDREVKLIHYLAKNRHCSPFRGTVFKFKVKAPIYVCRQWYKHAVSSCHTEEQNGWNEKSFRYTEINDPNEFYIPEQFYRQSESNRQASGDPLESVHNENAKAAFKAACSMSYYYYETLLSLGVSREDARGVLAPAVYTSWVWTASLQSVLHFIGLRKGKGAQSQIAAYASAIEQLIKPIVPVAIEAWEANPDNF